MGGHGASAGWFFCKSEVTTEHSSDPTGLRRIRRRDAKNLVFTVLFYALYRGEGEGMRTKESCAACCTAAGETGCSSVAVGHGHSHSPPWLC